MNQRLENFAVRALVSRENGEFVARALEMDLIGYGATPDEAVKELIEAVEAQITFSLHKKNPSMLIFRAEEEYFKRWEEANVKKVENSLLGDIPLKMDIAVTFAFTASRIKKLGQRSILPMALACA
jgi:hypothetical protein